MKNYMFFPYFVTLCHKLMLLPCCYVVVHNGDVKHQREVLCELRDSAVMSLDKAQLSSS